MKSKSFAESSYQDDDLIRNYNELINTAPISSKFPHSPSSSPNHKKHQSRKTQSVIIPKAHFPSLDNEALEKELFLRSKKISHLKKKVHKMEEENNHLRNEVESLEEEASKIIRNTQRIQEISNINKERFIALKHNYQKKYNEMNDIKAKRIRLENELLQTEERKKELEK